MEASVLSDEWFHAHDDVLRARRGAARRASSFTPAYTRRPPPLSLHHATAVNIMKRQNSFA